MKLFLLRIIFIPSFIIFPLILEWIITGHTKFSIKYSSELKKWYDENIMEPATKNF